MGKGTPLLQAFSAANDILSGAVQGIAELITRPGLINVDFADVRTVMSEMGMAMMGSGSGRGTDRARQAAEAAVSRPPASPGGCVRVEAAALQALRARLPAVAATAWRRQPPERSPGCWRVPCGTFVHQHAPNPRACRSWR